MGLKGQSYEVALCGQDAKTEIFSLALVQDCPEWNE